MKKLTVFICFGLVVAALIILILPAVPFNEQLLKLSLRQSLGPFAAGLATESMEIQALVLDYAHNGELVLKTKICLMKYQDMARRVFVTYGEVPDFQEILLKFGDPVIPVIYYFMTHDIYSLHIMKMIGGFWDRLKEFWSTRQGQESEKAETQSSSLRLGPEERGLFAIAYIKQEGHHFLGQFVVAGDKEVKWVQSDRVLQNLLAFFAGGIRNLEVKLYKGEQLKIRDLLEAGLDVAVLGGSFKLIRAIGKHAGMTKISHIPSRIRVFGGKLLMRGGKLHPVVKYGAIAATVYVLVRHPSLLNSILREVAHALGLNPILFQIMVWTIIITILLYPLARLLSILTAPFQRYYANLSGWRRATT